MTAKDIINYTIPPLKLSDNVEKAQKWMGEFHTNEFPVVDGGKYYGIFNESLIFDQQLTGRVISDFKLKGTGISVSPEEHYYEILKKSYSENLKPYCSSRS